MSWGDANYLERLAEQKSLPVGISGGVRSVEDRLAGKRLQPAEEKREHGAPLIIKQVVSHLVARSRDEDVHSTASKLYGAASDVAVAVTKSAVSPANTTTAGYAAE